MGFVGDLVNNALDIGKNFFGGLTGSDAAKASTDAAAIQADYQTKALDYLKETEAIPRQFREGALKQLGGVYGLEGGTGSQTDLISKAQNSPLYASLMGGQQAGEESIMRNASMTGGLRSGNVQGAMYNYNTQLQNSSLLSAYNEQLSGLQGMTGLASYAPQIAQATSNVGSTLASGQLGAAQTQQQGYGNMLSGIAQLLPLFI